MKLNFIKMGHVEGQTQLAVALWSAFYSTNCGYSVCEEKTLFNYSFLMYSRPCQSTEKGSRAKLETHTEVSHGQLLKLTILTGKHHTKVDLSKTGRDLGQQKWDSKFILVKRFWSHISENSHQTWPVQESAEDRLYQLLIVLDIGENEG